MKLTRQTIRTLIKEALDNQEREEKIEQISMSLANLESADVAYILNKVRANLNRQQASDES